jgi:ankyrin repeat protein
LEEGVRNKKIGIVLFTLGFLFPGASSADENANAQLVRAINLNDDLGVKSWLDKGADPNFKSDQRPVVILAANSGSAKIVQVLIAAKADIDALDEHGETALMHAAEYDKPAVLNLLVTAKAKLDVQNARGESALIMAINSHSPTMVKSLVEAKANLNLKTVDDNTAVMTAALANADESGAIISILAVGKADLNVGNSSHTPLSYACYLGNKSVVKALLDAGANPNLKTESGSFPLALAFEASEPEPIVTELLKAKANPNVISPSGETPLHLAAEKGLLENVKALIQAGADLNVKDNNGDTPLAAAKRSAHNDIAELLIQHGAA